MFGSDCNNNTFGSGCNNNTFGSGCDNNAFYYACDNNWFGSACNNNWFGSDCNNNTFGSACNNNVFGIEEYWTLDNYQYITFGSGCSGIVLHCTETTGYSQPYKNVEIKSGVTGEFDSFGVLLSYKTITDNNVNQSFHTTYKPVGSMEISV